MHSFLILLSLSFAAPAVENSLPLTPKGIYHAVDEYRRTGVKFFVELQETRKRSRPVPVTHGFQTGDRFTFSFEINRDSYIYVINETVDGRMVSGLAPKGIQRTSPPPPPQVSSGGAAPRLLFPTFQAGSNNRLRGEKAYVVPTRGYYRMDERTGTERLYVILSDRRLDLSEYFHADSGRIRGSSAAEKLRRRLGEWKENAEVELVGKFSPSRSPQGGKGVVLDVESYGVSIDSAEPAVVEIDLWHRR